jgi:hypothetical protein
MESPEEPQAENPPSPERPEGGPDSDNQPPPPPPESDPKQDTDENDGETSPDNPTPSGDEAPSG